MKKLISILAVMLAMPAFATDITGSSDCDNSTLGTYSAPVDMEAKWTANTINLQWYDDADDTNPASTMCTYNTTIALPTEPSKPGYNFTGWQLRVNYCDFSGVVNTDGTNPQGHGWRNNADVCFDYGVVVNCNTMSDIALNQWKTEFNHGIVRGVAICTDKAGDNHDFGWDGNNSDWIATDAEIAQASDSGQYCWCKMTKYAPTSGNACTVASPVWGFYDDYGSTSKCANNCAYDCAVNVGVTSDFRRAVYGITE